MYSHTIGVVSYNRRHAEKLSRVWYYKHTFMDSVFIKKQTKPNEDGRHNFAHKPPIRDPFLTPIRESPKKKWSWVAILIWFLIAFFFVAVLSLAGFFVYRFGFAAQQITGTESSQSPLTTFTEVASSAREENLDGFDDGRINILLLGIAGTEKPGAQLTDTIIIASIDTTTHKVALLSLPRDLLYKYPQGHHAKINTLYSRSIAANDSPQFLLDAVKDITGQSIHYYVVLDFAGFTQIIDTIGGVNVDVEFDIDDPRYPGPGYSYEHFTLEKGFQQFDGQTALKYARSRHNDPEGDFGRTKRQQKIMQAARHKMFSLGTILNPFRVNELLTTLSKHIDTNIAPDEIRSFISLVKQVDTTNITKVVVDAWKEDSLLRSVHVQLGNDIGAGLMPRTGDWSEITAHADAIFDLEQLAQRRSEIDGENATVILLNASGESRAADAVKNALETVPFASIDIDVAPKDYPQPDETIIIDQARQSKNFSMNELITLLGATRANQLPENFIYTDKSLDAEMRTRIDGANFVVILGKNVIKRYLYDEASQEDIEESNRETHEQN